uniref:Uncharacterized protein n=1 Tax=Timema genevievae TaxID=629358 RepID=A0A7R9PJT8_TIMGE|nr:unnamed protein product [Timema genevievae]
MTKQYLQSNRTLMTVRVIPLSGKDPRYQPEIEPWTPRLVASCIDHYITGLVTPIIVNSVFTFFQGHRGSIRTSLLAGSSFNVTWHLAYPHRHRFSLLVLRIRINYASELWRRNIFSFLRTIEVDSTAIFVECTYGDEGTVWCGTFGKLSLDYGN